jgi:hypothetical protein
MIFSVVFYGSYSSNNVTERQEVLGRTNGAISFDTTQTSYKTTRPAIILLCVFVAALAFLPNRCLATIRGYTCTQSDGKDL